MYLKRNKFVTNIIIRKIKKMKEGQENDNFSKKQQPMQFSNHNDNLKSKLHCWHILLVERLNNK